MVSIKYWSLLEATDFCVCGCKVERKQAFVCWGKVALVLSISSRGEKNRWDKGGQRALQWLTALFIWPVSDILLFPCKGPAFGLTWKWPGRDGSRPLFTSESTPAAPLRETQNTWGRFGLITSLTNQQLTHLNLNTCSKLCRRLSFKNC